MYYIDSIVKLKMPVLWQEVARRAGGQSCPATDGRVYRTIFTDWRAALRMGMVDGNRRKPNVGAQCTSQSDAQASREPIIEPASTSLKKCMPSVTRDAATLAAQNNRPARKSG